ncbi:hypothetical protein AJ80_05344 [Polytolypa hystricis UAMH7299]|uniref:Uncharacterized protein n=1 Tax=Polytolypa hystricis (strain UAMH7299) TaxID=1447883 RepID=A0A2B7Y4M4_POLH7|nr:hypothetical protein AJ80_05344 [Polytolypa hystricis UAMH7299]
MADEHTLGAKALGGEWEEIGAKNFEIVESMTMEFEGLSCNVVDNKGKLVETLGKDHGRVTREVGDGYKCFVMRAWVKFEKKSA